MAERALRRAHAQMPPTPHSSASRAVQQRPNALSCEVFARLRDRCSRCGGSSSGWHAAGGSAPRHKLTSGP